MDWDLFWTDSGITPEFLSKMSHHQKVNHFPGNFFSITILGMYSLARKNNLGKNLMNL